MRIHGYPLGERALAGEVTASLAQVNATQWVEAARRVHESGGRLVALWGTDDRDRDGTFAVYAAYAVKPGLVALELRVPQGEASFPELAGLFPVANRMQRAVRDLLGVEPAGAADLRPWLRHGAWRADEFPLRRDFDADAPRATAPDDYPFVRVEGDGVHEIAVGPVHAGTIEPGHFRFSVVGEKVLRLEERLGFKHKGIERRFADFDVGEGWRLAGRVSGDSTVAFAWAYAQAAESILGVAPPPRARWLRALMLERERVANHLGDLGALGNDAAFGFALAQFMRLKEDWLRLNGAIFGQRLLMDRIVPGGVTHDLGHEDGRHLVEQAHAIAREALILRDIFDEHSGLQDRFLTAGRVAPELAHALGLVGLAGRASGQAHDLRVDHPAPPYGELDVRKVVHKAGDVAARVQTRFDELFESLRLVQALVERMPAGPTHAPLPASPPAGFGVGWVEGWRGEAFVAIECAAGGRIRRCHVHDPSWQNWPVIEHAVMGNIVPDFPLINKSFNLSYSGVDG